MTVEHYTHGKGLYPVQQSSWFMNSPTPVGHARCFTNTHEDQVEIAPV
jgi:hypothetical protein